MKIEYKHGTVAAVAESVSDIETLLELVNGKATKENPWKGKHRKNCPQCGEKFVNVGVHARHAHKLMVGLVQPV